MEYRCVAASVTGFVQQLASCYLSHGYWFYVSGLVPERKDPRGVDAKLIEKYGIGISRQSRARRKSMGIANVHYLRYERHFLLLATHGQHPFFDSEEKNIRDARKTPIKFAGYSISVKQGGFQRKLSPGETPKRDTKLRVHVQIGQQQYQVLKAFFVDMAKRVSDEKIGMEFYCLPFEPYAPIRQQLLNILRLVNKARKPAGLEAVSPKVLRYQRKIVKPFDSDYISSKQEDDVAARPGGGGGEGGVLSKTVNKKNRVEGCSELIIVPSPPGGCSLDEKFLNWAWRHLDKPKK
jgi:hypothetical protein